MSYAFHANTLAFGGQLDDSGRAKYLPSQASVTLPPNGGTGVAEAGPFEQDGISFYGARSEVFGGSFADTDYNTFANVTVSNLDIEGRIQVAVLNARVTSLNHRENGCLGESRISFDANIVGLVIDGHPIEVDFNPEPFRRHGTFAEFVDSFTAMPEEEAKAFADAYNWPLEECQTTSNDERGTLTSFHIPRRCTTAIRASLLRSTTPRLAPGEISGITRKGFTIEVAGFGLIHLGEVLLKAGRRRINLLRVELNKTLDGSRMVRPTLLDAATGPRLVATALNTAPEALTLTGGSGGYTFASVEGNGTDFIP